MFREAPPPVLGRVGFVAMKADQGAQATIAALSGKEVDGRQLTVAISPPDPTPS